MVENYNDTAYFEDSCSGDQNGLEVSQWAPLPTIVSRRNSLPGTSFSGHPLVARVVDAGMGLAVARRTVFRAEDQEDFGLVARRVALGNMSLLGLPLVGDLEIERSRLENAIATGALITSGRHLQHGDADQASRNIEVFTNCATAIASFSEFYLLLNGSGVGRAYDDDLVVVDWSRAPALKLYLSPAHVDYPSTPDALCSLGIEVGVLPWGTRATSMSGVNTELVQAYIAREFLPDLDGVQDGDVLLRVEDSREGWAKAVELLEAMTFRGESHRNLVLDFSDVRANGCPINGMQNRPASGPISLMRAFLNIRTHVIDASRLPGACIALWEQAMLVDHYLSVEVQVGGARRAARMATKSWYDPGVLKFIRIKSEGGLWTANNSVMVDSEFWNCIQQGGDSELALHAHKVFDEVTRCSYVNGEPGFINGDKLEDHRTGSAWQKPVYEDGRDVRSSRYAVSEASALLAALSRKAAQAQFPVTTNPCGEIALHVTGGYCVIADFAPLLACPVEISTLFPGDHDPATAALWDNRVEDSVRLGVRFLMRANTMDALYGEEVRRTNRIGIGPTGLHEWAWMRFGLAFNDLLDDNVSSDFWSMMERLSMAAKSEAEIYARELGVNTPVTVTTVKPAGTTSKLFGLTEGAHLPARRQYLRWVQFRGTRDESGQWRDGSDPLLGDYERRGYPVRELQSFQGMSIVGFPTVPRIVRMGLGDRLVTAPEANPEDQFSWLRLLEKHWIGAERGNQVSYTLKVYTDKVDLQAFRKIIAVEQSRVRCCAVMPSRPDSELGYEYLPEEEVSMEKFAALVGALDVSDAEAIDVAHMQCASGVCPM